MLNKDESGRATGARPHTRRTIDQVMLGSGGVDHIKPQPEEMASMIDRGLRDITAALNAPGALRESTDREKAIAKLTRRTLEVLTEQFKRNTSSPEVLELLFKKLVANKALNNSKIFVGNVQAYYDARAKGKEMRHDANLVRDIFEVFDLFGSPFYEEFPKPVGSAHGTRSLVVIPGEAARGRTMNELRKERAQVRGYRITGVAYPLLDKLAQLSTRGLTDEYLAKQGITLTAEEKEFMVALARLVGLRFKSRLRDRITDIVRAQKLSPESLNDEQRSEFIRDNLELLVPLTTLENEKLQETLSTMSDNDAVAYKEQYLRDRWNQIGEDFKGEPQGTGLQRQNLRIQGIFRDAYLEKLDEIDTALDGLAKEDSKFGIVRANGQGIRFDALIRNLEAYMRWQRGDKEAISRGSNFIRTFGGYLGVKKAFPTDLEVVQKEVLSEEERIADEGEIAEEQIEEHETSPEIVKTINTANKEARNIQKEHSRAFDMYLVPMLQMISPDIPPLTDPMLALLAKTHQYLLIRDQRCDAILSKLEEIKKNHEAAVADSPNRLNSQALDRMVTAYGRAKEVSADIKRVIRGVESKALSLPEFQGRLPELMQRYASVSLMALLKEAQGPVDMRDDGTFESKFFTFVEDVMVPELKEWEVPGRSGEYKTGWKTHMSKFDTKVNDLLTRVNAVSSFRESNRPAAYEAFARELEAVREELKVLREMRIAIGELEQDMKKKNSGKMSKDDIETIKALLGSVPSPRPAKEVVELLLKFKK